MAKPVLMPKQGITVEQCILTKWHKKVGEHVSVGEVLFSYETDKSSFDQESEVEGEILVQLFNDGDAVSMETLLEKGVIRKELNGLKVLGRGEITKKLTVKAAIFSVSAKEKIEAAGGKAEVI